MGATKSTQNIQMKILTGDGNGAFWSYRQSNGGEILDVKFNGKNAIVSDSQKLDWSDTFYEAIDDLNQKSNTLPVTDQKTIVSNSSISGIEDQFEEPLMTDSNIDDIAGWYDPEDFCCKLGAMEMVRRFLERNQLTWSGGADNADDIYIYLGQKNKADQVEIQAEITTLTYNATITENQANDFWIRWSNEVINQ